MFGINLVTNKKMYSTSWQVAIVYFVNLRESETYIYMVITKK